MKDCYNVSRYAGSRPTPSMMACAIQSLYFSVCVKLIEIADTESQIGVGEELDCFRFFYAHKERVDVFFDSPFLQKGSKCPSCFLVT